MAYALKILADSISPAGHRLTTFESTFPRIVLAEVNTHRMLSRNSASSRAIPVAKKIAQIESDPFIPEVFGKNMKGMQHAELLEEQAQEFSRASWREASERAVRYAKQLEAFGVHKQLANRLLEPFAWHTAILTATDWSNFFHLRVNPEAQGEFRTCAAMMKELYDSSTPHVLRGGEWHLPLCPDIAGPTGGETIPDRPVEWWNLWSRISAARCGRVSFLTHDGKRDTDEDLKLYDRLLQSGHMSPLEHAARPMTDFELDLFERSRFRYVPADGLNWQFVEPTYYCGNLNGWVSLRSMIPGEEDILGYRKASP